MRATASKTIPKAAANALSQRRRSGVSQPRSQFCSRVLKIVKSNIWCGPPCDCDFVLQRRDLPLAQVEIRALHKREDRNVAGLCSAATDVVDGPEADADLPRHGLHGSFQIEASIDLRSHQPTHLVRCLGRAHRMAPLSTPVATSAIRAPVWSPASDLEKTVELMALELLRIDAKSLLAGLSEALLVLGLTAVFSGMGPEPGRCSPPPCVAYAAISGEVAWPK